MNLLELSGWNFTIWRCCYWNNDDDDYKNNDNNNNIKGKAVKDKSKTLWKTPWKIERNPPGWRIYTNIRQSFEQAIIIHTHARTHTLHASQKTGNPFCTNWNYIAGMYVGVYLFIMFYISIQKHISRIKLRARVQIEKIAKCFRSLSQFSTVYLRSWKKFTHFKVVYCARYTKVV